MKALVFNGPKDIRYESYDDPELRTPNSAIVKVKKCSICGSDLHMYHGANIGTNEYGEDTHKFCTGHEFIGEVVEVGADTHTLKVGDKVLSAGGTGCGRCKYCLTGRANQCKSATAFGIGPSLQGGQAEYVNIPNADFTLMKTDGAVSDEHAILLTDAMATAYFGLVRADVSPGSTVAVVGLGPIGILGVELAYAMGAARVIAIDPVESRRKAAEAVGAIALEPNEDMPAKIAELTKGAGVPSVFEASGAIPAINSAVDLVAWGGTISAIGLPSPKAGASVMKLLIKNATFRAGVARIQETWPHLLPLIATGKVKGEGLFTHKFKLSEGSEAYRLFDAREDDVVKVMIDVD